MISLRPADLATDLPAMAQLLSLAQAEPLSSERVSEWWQRRESGMGLTSVACDGQGQVIGLVDAVDDAWLRPGYYRLTVVVEPTWRRQGIGTRLYAEGLEFAQGRGTRGLICTVRDNAPAALRFAEHRGFCLDRHLFESSLDLTCFDERPYASVLERAGASGLRFFTLADLGPVTEEAQRRLYELNRITGLDNPGNSGAFPSFEAFRTAVLEAPWFRADGQILAAGEGQWIGLAAVAFFTQADYAYNAFTGVIRPYRGRGLATALKLLAIRYAQRHGYRTIRTNNDSQNAPMLAINRKLGYRPELGEYRLLRDLA